MRNFLLFSLLLGVTFSFVIVNFIDFQDDFQLFPGHGDDDTVINIKNNNPFIREYLK